MGPNLKEKVERALRKACENDPQAVIELEDVPPDKIAGRVLSASFGSLSPSERQDRIWMQLDDALDKQERTKIVFIVTDTPEEWRVLHEAAAGQ
jgi:hypothetical protein